MVRAKETLSFNMAVQKAQSPDLIVNTTFFATVIQSIPLPGNFCPLVYTSPKRLPLEAVANGLHVQGAFRLVTQEHAIEPKCSVDVKL